MKTILYGVVLLFAFLPLSVNANDCQKVNVLFENNTHTTWSMRASEQNEFPTSLPPQDSIGYIKHPHMGSIELQGLTANTTAFSLRMLFNLCAISNQVPEIDHSSNSALPITVSTNYNQADRTVFIKIDNKDGG